MARWLKRTAVALLATTAVVFAVVTVSAWIGWDMEFAAAFWGGMVFQALRPEL